MTIVCHEDESWERLRGALGDPAWSRDERFATNALRLAHVELLEEHLAAWTRDRTPEDVMTLLQSVGVEAGVVENNEDLNRDPQLAARRHFRALDHPVIGQHVVETNGIRFSASPEEIRQPAPLLGQHTEHVFRTLLGMSENEYRDLEERGAFQ